MIPQTQKEIVQTLKNELLTAKQISENIDVSYKTCFNHLTKLRELNHIELLENKAYALTDSGFIFYGLDKPQIQPKTIKKPREGFKKMTTEVKSKTVEIVKHDAPIQYVPINEKTEDEIKQHVNGTKCTTPDYYKGKSIEVFDVLDEFLTTEAVSGFWVGNVVKYVLRYRGKNGKDDLLKARDYLNKLIDSL